MNDHLKKLEMYEGSCWGATVEGCQERVDVASEGVGVVGVFAVAEDGNVACLAQEVVMGDDVAHARLVEVIRIKGGVALDDCAGCGENEKNERKGGLHCLCWFLLWKQKSDLVLCC
jgi:hypothetical protein